MAKKRKFYVVWVGRAPGIYDTWAETLAQVDGYPGARYRAFNDQDEATMAFRQGMDAQEDPWVLFRKINEHQTQANVRNYSEMPVRTDAIAVDGACSANPGPMEYRGVWVSDGTEVFRKGPFAGGTNNIGEYLAIIHAAAMLKNRGDTTTPIYSDSRTALSWVQRGGNRTKLQPTVENAELMAILARADAWLRANGPVANPLLKWDTTAWGEIPADFGRK